jgi:hypothetical protein
MGMNSMRQHREKMLAEKALKAQQSLIHVRKCQRILLQVLIISSKQVLKH